MAGKKENLKALFSNSRTRIIILATGMLMLLAVVIGLIKFTGLTKQTVESSAGLSGAPGISSVPGTTNPTQQYKTLQQTQNVDQAQQAEKKGSSAIPTIIQTHEFGNGVDSIGPQQGEGAVGFEKLAMEETSGPQQSLWLQSLKDANCSKASVADVMNQGAGFGDLKKACSCVQLKDDGYQLNDLKPICSCKELKSAGFNARQLKEAGLTAEGLRLCGFDACELRGGGFTAQEMKDGGFSDGELKGAGYPEQEITQTGGLPDGVSAEDVRKAGCGATALQSLRAAGVTASAIRQISGCSAAQLKAAGFSAADLKHAGFSAADLKNAGFSPAQLKQAGYSARDLLNAGVSPADLKAAGYTSNELKAAEGELPPGMTPENVKANGCSDAALRRERLAGVSAALIHQYAGCSAEALKSAGFTDGELTNAGFTPAEMNGAGSPLGDQAIKAAGCDPEKLHALLIQGVSASRIHELNGCSASTLKQAGFDAKALSAAGFTPAQLLAAGFTPAEVKAAEEAVNNAIKAAGCDPQKLHALMLQGISATRIHDLNGCTAATLKQAGFDAKQLAAAGFTPAQLIAAGFTPAEVKAAQPSAYDAIKNAGCDPQKLHALMLKGVSASQIHALNGCSATALKQAGFDAKQLAAAGFTPEQLLAAGFTPSEIKAAEEAVNNAIKASGCDPQKLHALMLQGISAKRIRDLNGCTADALKQAGFDAGELAAAGFTPAQLLAAGFTPEQVSEANPVDPAVIKAAGCDPQKLHELLLQGVTAKRIRELNGCSADALKQAGFDAKALTAAGFTPAQLLAAGFTPAEVQAAQPPKDAVVQAAGCDPDKLHALMLQGVDASRIRKLNGCSADALRKAGFDAKELAAAGFTPDQLLAAGFTPAQVQAAQPSDASIKAAGCDSEKLHALMLQGVDAARIHTLNGCTAQDLKKAGFDAQALSAAGFTPKELLAAGFKAGETNGPQAVSDDAVKAAGCDPQKLHELMIQGVSASRIRELNGCTADALKQAGFDAKELSAAGFTPSQLLAAGFSPAQVRAASPVADDSIKAAGCDPQKLHALMMQGVEASRIRTLNGCSLDALKKAGFSAKDLASAGFSPQQLLNAGFTPEEVRAAQSVAKDTIKAAGCDPQKLHTLMMQGVSASEISTLNGCSADALKKAGFDAAELTAAGFTPAQLLAAGFSPAQISAAGAAAVNTANDGAIKAAGCDPEKLHALMVKGISATRIHQLNGCSASVLKQAGFDAQQLADAGFTPAELLSAGFTPEQLLQAGLNPAGVIAAGRTADCSVASLTAAHNLGVSAATLKQTLGCSAKALKDAGYTAAELKNAGFTAADLKNAGFSVDDLRKAGFSAKDLRAAGFTAQQLKDAGFSAEQLKSAGYNAADLKAAGFSAEQLKAAGFSASDLKKAGYSAEALKKAGFGAKELKEAGFSATQLKNAGYTTAQLQKAGFSAEDSTLAGLSEASIPTATSAVATMPSFANQPTTSTSAQAANAKQLQDILKRQQSQIAEQRYQQKIDQRSNVMQGAAAQALSAWKTQTTQVYIGGTPPKNAANRGGAGGGPGEGSVAAGGAASSANDGKPAVLKAGDVVFAVLDTSVNTDEPGPILATIVSGKLKGSKLIGSFTLPNNADKMVINFNTMSVPGVAKSTGISAFAIDPNTARTALSTRANHHYLLRYGSLFAATFLEGFGNAFQSANTTITIGGPGGPSQNTTIQNGVGRTTLENAVIGLATLGKSWGQVAQQQFSTPATVELCSGTGIGVLFTQDLTSL